jgi:hypothetical protein
MRAHRLMSPANFTFSNRTKPNPLLQKRSKEFRIENATLSSAYSAPLDTLEWNVGPSQPKLKT